MKKWIICKVLVHKPFKNIVKGIMSCWIAKKPLHLTVIPYGKSLTCSFEKVCKNCSEKYIILYSNNWQMLQQQCDLKLFWLLWKAIFLESMLTFLSSQAYKAKTPECSVKLQPNHHTNLSDVKTAKKNTIKS